MLTSRTLLAALVVAIVASTLPPIPAVRAQSETDRLRDALRSATGQVRALEDQRTALQAQLAETTRSRDALREQISEARAQAKKAESDYRTAVREFNERLEERNQTLEKWRDAYAEAATVARTKDAERAKFEALSKGLQTSVRACTIKNQELVKVGRELLARYEGVTFGDIVGANEPLLGMGRVRIQNLLQDYGDRVLNQKVEP
jgi:hypothetical protein